MKDFNRPTMLMILDGFGIAGDDKRSAIAKADKPALDRIFSSYPGTSVSASGLDVGLPEGQMGNSEVGHLNIGAGRIVYQELTNITRFIENETFFRNDALLSVMNHVKKNNSALHLMGLLSDGGVHSHITHLFALLKMAKMNGLKRVYVHCILDGRDVPPKCALEYISELEKFMVVEDIGQIATISGRYYTMDRDKRWDRVEQAYDAMTLGDGFVYGAAAEALTEAYDRGESDEFVKPTVIAGGYRKPGLVNDSDGMVMFNFRPDRAREITRAFTDTDFEGFERERVIDDLCYVCMTQYDAAIENVLTAYPPQTLKNTLGEYISSLGMKQLRIAETEKYAHVTFFFNGGVETPCPGEERILIPSPKVATYDLKPEMSACEVTDAVIAEIEKDTFDLIILNFANADMVGHTGVMEAASAAIEALDKCVPRIVDAVLEKDGQILLTADHGNADCMLDEKGNIVTAHSLNPVPLYHIAAEPKALAEGGKLADLAPTLLDLMHLPVPEEMTGHSLIKK